MQILHFTIKDAFTGNNKDDVSQCMLDSSSLHSYTVFMPWKMDKQGEQLGQS